MRVLLIDNYDSFTYNLVHLLEELNAEVVVRFNDEINLEEIDEFHKILLSPGPGLPKEAGLMNEIIQKYAPSKSIFGVCLGMQAIAEVFGGSLVNLNQVYHGSATPIHITDSSEYIFNGLEKKLIVGRYHSWAVKHPVSENLIVSSIDDFQNIMSIRHKEFDVRGVQFHPESYMTPSGKTILSNWLNH